jgi:hypothetical protein
MTFLDGFILGNAFGLCVLLIAQYFKERKAQEK